MNIKLTIKDRVVIIQKDNDKPIESRLSWFNKLSCHDMIEMLRNGQYKGR